MVLVLISQYYLNGSSASSLYGNNDFSDGLWHHAAVVWDNSANTLTLFVDGVQYLQHTGLTASNTWIFFVSLYNVTAFVISAENGSEA